MVNQSRIATFNAANAYEILAGELAAFRALSYQELSQLVGPPAPRRVTDAASVEYAIEVTVRWRNALSGELVVQGWIAVDDCGPMRRLDEMFVVASPGPPQIEAIPSHPPQS